MSEKTFQNELNLFLKPSALFQPRKFKPSVTSSPHPPRPSNALFSPPNSGCDTAWVCTLRPCMWNAGQSGVSWSIIDFLAEREWTEGSFWCWRPTHFKLAESASVEWARHSKEVSKC